MPATHVPDTHVLATHACYSCLPLMRLLLMCLSLHACKYDIKICKAEGCARQKVQTFTFTICTNVTPAP